MISMGSFSQVRPMISCDRYAPISSLVPTLWFSTYVSVTQTGFSKSICWVAKFYQPSELGREALSDKRCQPSLSCKGNSYNLNSDRQIEVSKVLKFESLHY